MEDAIEQLQTKDTKERLSGVERLQVLLEQSRKSLTANEVGSLVDASLVLLKDNNFRVAHGTLQALASAAALAGEHLKLHFNALLPAIVERLGDGKQPVRDASRQLLLALMEISSPTIIVERARGFAWGHRKWRVREEFARTVASAVNLFAATELPFQRMLLPSVLQLLEDPNSSVREAAMLCLEEMYRQGGSQFRDELQGYQLRPAQFRDIAVRFETIGPTRGSLEASINANAPSSQLSISGGPERKLSVPTPSARRSSPRVKPASIDVSGGSDRDALDNHVEAIRVFSEKELIKEMEKAAALLTPEQDWSVRIAAMQRLEGLVVGGAAEYACFMPLMKQLVGPLTSQLSDRRSSIVKQACQLLNLMSKELLVNFEIFAESFIPVLFKLVVITVLVIAESADICIKTMLRNCRVSRVLPKLVECAKHDRNSVLRARCCEYALLVLEQWGHSPEIQRSVELYEELIKCCVGDAMSEVRCTARSCYRVFSKCWPERARRIFVTFDASVQRLVNEESAGPLKRYPFQSSHDWGSYADQHQLRQSSDVAVTALRPPVASHTALGGYSNAVETNAESGSSALGFPLNKAYGRNSVEVSQDKALSKILLASQQQVSAIESMLKGAGKMDKVRSFGNSEKAPEVSEKGSLYSTLGDSSSNRIGVDRPSARDPPYPASAPASNQGVALGSSRPASSGSVGGVDNFAHQLGIYSTDRAYGHTGLDSDSSGNDDGFLTTGAATRSINGYFGGDKGAKRVMRAEYVDKGLLDSSSIPAYQRPLLRQRSSGMNRNAGDENPLLAQFNTRGGDMFKYGENVTPLSDALTEGLSGSSDWSARVAAFTALRKLFQQGPKGLQEINQSFALVMKLFSAHLDDPHHKVAQAALSTLADLVPACRKPFEAYLERILPHLFGRLVDPKEMIRQLGATSLEVIGNTYSIDSLLPALLRSLDEQRSPKAKVTVIEFAMVAFAKLASKNGESAAGTSLLRLWLAKLGPLANDKNPKLKETAVTGIISVYSHFDSTTVLNFILGLSIEEQSVLRRSLKQYTPRIEVDLMTYLQNKSHRGRPKSVHDQMDSSSPSDNYIEPSRSAYSSLTNNQSGMGYSSSSVNSDGGRKWRGGQHEVSETGNRLSHHLSATDSNLDNYRSFEPSPSSVGDSLGYLNVDRNQPGKMKEVMNDVDGVDHKPTRSALWLGDAERHSVAIGHEDKVDSKESVANFDPRAGTVLLPESTKRSQFQSEALVKYDDKFVWKGGQRPGSEGDEVTVPELLEQMVDPSIPKKKKYDIFHLLTSTRINDSAAWSEHFDHIWAIILEAIDGDDDDGAIKELALSTTLDVLNHQRQRLVDSTELLLEKLLLASACPDLKVSNAADGCKAIVLAEFDPHRCLAVVVRLLLSKDEKLLVTCISSLTKLVGRLSNEELMAQLPSFLPALFDAFGNRNADVRKTVVFCLVEVYIVLGKAFVPYLGSLSSTQLRLVTIYANRISQARTGTALESLQL